MSKVINLGRKPGEDIEIHKLSDLKDKTYYPSLYLGDVDDDRLLNLPDEGKCIISYKIRRREQREVKREGEKPKRSCTLDMDIISIESPPGKNYYGNGNGKKDKDDYDGGARKAASDYFKDK